METKLTTAHELRKKISVQYFELAKSGLIIDYKFNGVDHSIECDPKDSCSHLKAAGLINSFEKTRRGLDISFDSEFDDFDNEGRSVKQNKTLYTTWDEFVLGTSFTQLDAISVAANHARSLIVSEAVKENQSYSKPKHSFA